MNFPPILFYDQRFANISTNNYPNQFSSSLISYQNLYKKLIKFENKDKSFQQSVITWLKSLSKIQLIKYFSFSNQWLVDVLHDMILISICKPSTRFIFNPSIKNKEVILSYYNLFDQENIYLYNPNFSDYFTECESGFINLSKNSEQDKIQKRFLDHIRYLTIPINNQNNYNYNYHNNNSHNNHNYHNNNYNGNNNNTNKEKNEKYFFEYNNVVTVSFEYLNNLDNLIETMQSISKKELFKNPIELHTEFCENGRKYYYNPLLPKWLKPEFSIAELLCSYFELSILINYQYYILYQQEINMLYYDKLEDLMNNFFKLLEFIGNQTDDKRIAVMQSVKHDEIKSIFNENHNLRKIIAAKKEKNDKIYIYYSEYYKDHKKKSVKEIIENTMIKYENLFIKGDLNFLLNITFIRNNILFTEEDFITKIVFDKINSYWKSKAAEDLLHELTTNYSNNNNKKKKKKKKRKNKNEENKDKEKDNNKNNENKIEENKIDDNNDTENTNNKNNEIKNNEKDKNEINKIKENENIINIDDYKEKNNINNNELIKKITKESNLNLMEKNEKLNSNQTDMTEKSNNDKLNNNQEINNIINEEENINNNKNEIIEEEQKDYNEENSNKKKKEKNFFLYPVVKSKNKKKNKNKKNKKQNNNINNLNNNALSTKNENKIIEKEKENNYIIKDQKESKNQNKINYIYNNKTEEKYQTTKNEFEYSSKQKNKFNMNMQYKNINKDKTNNYIQYELNSYFNKKKNNQYFQIEELSNTNSNKNGNNGIYNQNKSESNISRSKEDNKYLLAGSSFPRFTSFYFNSKKRNHRNKHNKEISPYSFISNNISELSKEIMDNSLKVDKNKDLLQKIREKYIKNIYENINIILRDEKIDFLSSFYGSSISGLSIENSDIDIMVKIKQNINEINLVNRIMQNMVFYLKKNNINYITNIMPIYTASVPVIKIECDLSNDEYFSGQINTILKNCDLFYNDITKLHFDITFFEVENVKDKIPSEQMIDYIKESIILYPQIKDIIYIMKRFLFNRKLNKSYQGGISSYSLFLLTLAFIKNFKNYQDIPIGSFLIEYLNYYSNFDFYCYAIQPNKDIDKEIYLKNEENNIYKYNLKIIDPITGINVAKSTFKIEQIKNAFKEGLDIIISNLYKVNGIDECNNNIKNKKILDNLLAK